MHLPSAGMIRFRFNGSAFASQPVARHPEVFLNIGPMRAGARGRKGLMPCPPQGYPHQA